MILDIGKFNINETPHRFSYNPEDNYWYQASRVEDFEPKETAITVEDFSFTTTLGSLEKSAEENELDFKNFVAYHHGIDNGTTEYTVTLSNFPLAEDLKIQLEFWNFEELKLFADTIEQGESVTRYCDKISAVKFYAWLKEDNKVHFAIQKYQPVTDDYNKDFVFIYDVIVDKTQLVTAIKNFIDEFYYKKIIDSFKQYEQEHNIEFTNPRKHIDLANVLKYHFEELSKELEKEKEKEKEEEKPDPDMPDKLWDMVKEFDRIESNKREIGNEAYKQADNELKKLEETPSYKDWNAKKYITATELEEFINELKPKIIEQPINNISITGHLYDPFDYEKITEVNGKYYMYAEWCGNDENGNEILDFNSSGEVDESEIHYCNGTIEEYCAELDEPAVIQIGDDIQFEIDFSEHSLAQIGINSLKQGEYSSFYDGAYEWRDISGFYSKNIIGHKIKDVYINKTTQPSISWEVKRQEGDDMYDKITFVLDNGYKLDIYCFTDYMEIAEVVG